MKIFNLPDLGEGLPEATVREWHIKEGDTVAIDQPIASVETAKALVEVPSPYAGVIEKLYGVAGDVITTGKPFVGFKGEATETGKSADKGTVVGNIETATDNTATATLAINTSSAIATPAVRALARRLGVDLTKIDNTDKISKDDVYQLAKAENTLSGTPLSPIQEAMACTMQNAQQQVAGMTVHDDVVISAWFKKEDLTIKVIQALCYAISIEPMLNSHYHPRTQHYQNFAEVNLGLAVDTEHGLFVPVIHNAQSKDNAELRAHIDQYKEQAQTKSIPQDKLKKATIVYSNVGTFATKYATPIVSPPTVAILATGRVYKGVDIIDNTLQPAWLLPLSISADHRLITGGQLTRFLKALKENIT